MARKHSREEILTRLKKTVSEGRAVIGAGAGTGISAKFLERGGIDFIVIYNSGRFRMAGLPSTAGLLAYGDANAIVMEMGEREILPVVEDVPVLAGVNGTDPTRLMTTFLPRVSAAGFSGVNNFPTVGAFDGTIRQVLEDNGLGYYREVEMIRLAREMDLFTAVYVYDPEEAIAMARAGTDCIIAHMRTTVGGDIGAKFSITLEEAVERTQSIVRAAKGENPDIISLCHGGPISTPEDAARVIEKTDVVGFVGASSMERLATEMAIQGITEKFKKIRL
jgi:predicted TIM-barrel enzyme